MQNERIISSSFGVDSIGLPPDSTFFTARAHAVFGIFMFIAAVYAHAAVDCRKSYPTIDLINQSTSINTKWDWGGGSDWV